MMLASQALKACVPHLPRLVSAVPVDVMWLYAWLQQAVSAPI